MSRLFVILPCYNEEANITPLILAWLDQREALSRLGYELVVTPVDDGSKDGTKAVIEELQRTHPDIALLAHQTNQGLGAGLKTGLLHFHQTGTTGDCAVVMDADNTHDPKYAASMLTMLSRDHRDCVIASRYCQDSAVVGVPAFRNFLSLGARAYYRLVLGVKGVKDYTCGYRVYTHDIIDRAVKKYGDRMVEEQGFSCMMELLYKLSRVGAVFGEVPFELRYDFKQGSSKMKILSTIKDSLVTAPRLRLTIR
ncbi:MAG: glycosyltransferase family 2 protein [Propionibacteriaceae bacterium]|jgi:dolichol-phosphate mannosyltransferase|nr:glycosyltransferase family 2 protein [Propionibacteriaceae bacterium]